jgi:hypothetical protein
MRMSLGAGMITALAGHRFLAYKKPGRVQPRESVKQLAEPVS